ncbi:MAG TPA: CBS domain-containing protein [Candidatus Dormibacteraeota bacterium]|nr:CBS domain-containing protein [Candidatus Dormibacteraeota bacterium]
MRTRPKTLPGDANVGDLRRLFANPRVLDVVLVDGVAFVGVVDRDDVDDPLDDTPAQALAHSAGVTIGAEATQDEAMARLEADGTWRLVVVGSDGVTLEGLLCLNAKRNWVLSVASRTSYPARPESSQI